ncbi:MAG: MetQ/NlpA family ABC transporter substrate-binding protein [Anaerolineae bacterium]|jgi:NitT/TauT family transport system substrate-binding protein
MTRGLVVRLVALVSLGLALAGCGGRAEPATLRIGVLPILDTLPMYVATEEGSFVEHGVEVVFVTAASAAERDQLLQAGEVDGIITDLVALALYNRDDARVVAVRYAMTPTPEFAQFRVLASRPSEIVSPEELAGVEIGVSEGTVIEYVTDRMLEAQGLSPGEIATLAVPRIPERMALLGSGELSAATLPEPLASLAMQDGAVVVVDDREHIETSCSVYAFRKEILDEHPDAVGGFLAAVSEASKQINADKDRWSDLLGEKELVPRPLMGSYQLPDYPGDEVPSTAQFSDAVNWLQETGLLTQGPSYVDSVDSSFLP